MRLIDVDGLIKMIQEQAGCDKCDNYEGVKCRACQWDDMIATVEDYADNHPEGFPDDDDIVITKASPATWGIR